MQVCDRRSVFPPTSARPTYRIADDTTVKAVIFQKHSVFTYAGYAQLIRTEAMARWRGGLLEEIPTNLWLAEILAAAQDPQNLIETLAGELNSSLDAMGVSIDDREHLFYGTGWGNQENEKDLSPVVFSVSSAGSEVKAQWFRPLAGVTYSVFSSRPLGARTEEQVHTFVREHWAEQHAPAKVEEMLVGVLRDYSRRDETVGLDALVVCLPRIPIENVSPDGFYFELGTGRATLERPTFNLDSEGERGAVIEGPAAVFGGTIIQRLNIGGGGALNIGIV